VAKAFPDGRPAVIRALNRAVTMPTTWGGAETVAASAQRSSFAGLELSGRNVILDGLELLAKSGPTRHSNAGRQLWRNCYVNGVDGAESTQILLDIDESTGHTIGIRDCYFHKPRAAGAGTGDYGLRIHETHAVWVLRCLWDGAWVHGTSWKNRSSGGVLDCFFRACGSLDMDVGQSPDWTSAGSSVAEENSCTTILIRRNRFAGAALKRNGAPYCGLRVKNVDTCEITDNVFLGSLEIPIHVNYVPKAGGQNLSGTHQTTEINNLGPPRPDQLTIDRNSFAGGKVVLNCRGRAAEVIRFRDNTGTVASAQFGRFNPENITSEAGIPMDPAQIDLDAYPTMVISGNAFPVTRSTTLLG
jgi:hypothetical protein